MTRSRQETTTVYFARLGDYIKVGSATNVHRRLRSLSTRPQQVKCPEDILMGDLELLGTIPGSYDLEFDIQCHLWPWRAAGEWFDAAPEVLDFVGDVCAGADVDALAEALRPAAPTPARRRRRSA